MADQSCVAHQSYVAFFCSTEVFALKVIFLFIHQFFERNMNFCGSLSVPHLVDNYAKNVDERGRNIMCERTLPSVLVSFPANKLEIDLRMIFLKNCISNAVLKYADM